jgi:two-component system, OmpR family, sensor histidine kinase TctE
LKNQNNNSIRIQLLLSLLVPLCLLWFISALVAFYLAVGFANSAYDHGLANSADSVAARLRSDGERILVDLPPAAQAILRHNDKDKFYFQILRKDGTRISGDSILPLPVSRLDAEQPIFRYAKLDGREIRMARIRVDVPKYPDEIVLVQVAETLNSRRELAHQILLSIVIPQMILIVLGALAVWRGVARGLAPLKRLEQALSVRSQLDLTPVASNNVPSEVRPLVNEINSLLGKLAEDIESQKRFVANAAHQFRTPLAALKTYIYYAKRLPSDKQMNEILDKIDSGMERMSHLSNKLLALAKTEPANRADRNQNVDLNYLVSEVTAALVPEATKKNVQLAFVGSDRPAIVYGDAHNLSELAGNLIENAVFYTDIGGEVAVSVSNGDEVRLVVHDNGRGIPERERDRVFERFYRLLGTDVPGSGLGLAIVKEIAAAHNAEVSIDTGTSGKGTVVTVVFASKVKKPV